jgi:outer membrane protein assembly factor BamA
MRPFPFLFVLPFLYCTTLPGQKHSHAHKKFMGFHSLDDTISTERTGVFVLPLIYYTPDTRWAFGAAGVYYFKIVPKKEDEHETRMSVVQFLADYTQNKQLDVWSQWNIFTRNENYLLKGELRYRNFPDRFYGLGNETKKENEERYEYSLVSFKNLLLKKLRPGLFLGFDYNCEIEYGFKYTPGGVLESGTVPGYNGAIGSALGLVGVYDTRDNVINAYKGKLIEVSSYFYNRFIGATFNFVNLNGIYQQYWQLRKKHILAVQSKLRFAFGDAPFLDMSTLGNDDILRGYAKNRFRDRHFWGAQAEYRFPLFWRFGAVVFGGVGDVFSDHKDLAFSSVKYSFGGGLRFVINPAERLNIRFDYGYGREGGHFYFVVAESF